MRSFEVLGAIVFLPGFALTAAAQSEQIDYLCQMTEARLANGEIIGVDDIMIFSIQGGSIANAEEVCKGGKVLDVAASDTAFVLDCRDTETAKTMTVARPLGDFKLVSRSLSDPDVTITYVGVCRLKPDGG